MKTGRACIIERERRSTGRVGGGQCQFDTDAEWRQRIGVGIIDLLRAAVDRNGVIGRAVRQRTRIVIRVRVSNERKISVGYFDVIG